MAQERQRPRSLEGKVAAEVICSGEAGALECDGRAQRRHRFVSARGISAVEVSRKTSCNEKSSHRCCNATGFQSDVDAALCHRTPRFALRALVTAARWPAAAFFWRGEAFDDEVDRLKREL